MALLGDNISVNGEVAGDYIFSAGGAGALQVQVVTDALKDQFCVSFSASIDSGVTYEPTGIVINRAKSGVTHGFVLPANAQLKASVSGLNGSVLDIQIL